MMLEAFLLDNDVVLKMCAYMAADRLVEVATYNGQKPAVLGLARYSLHTQVRRSKSIEDHDTAAEQLSIFFAGAQLLEPTGDEIAFAAELEEEAILGGLELDSGESQLVALMLFRVGPLIVTGDKRALLALAAVAPTLANSRFACLEQLVASLMSIECSAESLRTAVCMCPKVDKAIAICFSCAASNVSSAEVMEGLRSYAEDLRRRAGRLMIPSDDLVAVTPKENRVGFI